MGDKISSMTAAEFAAAQNVSRETLGRLETYAALLIKWQSAINLVGADSLADLWRRHMLDSAQLAAHVPPGAKVLTDMGSGAGFPGLVLAILLDRPVHLIESSGKKATFLREVAHQTGAPATIHQGRIEALSPWPSDVVMSRALAPLDRLLDYASPYLWLSGPSATGLFLKGARAEQELTEAGKNWTMTVDRFQSETDPTGVILHIRDLARDGPSGSRR